MVNYNEIQHRREWLAFSTSPSDDIMKAEDDFKSSDGSDLPDSGCIFL